MSLFVVHSRQFYRYFRIDKDLSNPQKDQSYILSETGINDDDDDTFHYI